LRHRYADVGFTCHLICHDPFHLDFSVENCVAALGGHKKIDLFECARVDPHVSIEDTITTLAGFVKEGLFDYIGLSEVAAATVRRAAQVYDVARATTSCLISVDPDPPDCCRGDRSFAVVL
jgi:aryl-alcohol dehydrogenase-like predicted oxidoreductase